MAIRDVKAVVDSLLTNKAKIGANNYPTSTGTNGQVLQTNGACEPFPGVLYVAFIITTD
jgi:hypothetical protein